MSTWIDFRALRASLDFGRVLQKYGVEMNRKGDQHLGFCPLPNHQGKRNSKSFSANIARGIFKCFGCGAHGNILDFAALMENCDPADGEALRKIALKLRDEFAPAEPAVKQKPPKKESEKDAKTSVPLPLFVNTPLDFELKDLDAKHPYLLKRGLAEKTIAYFGLGFCRRGLLKDRIAIPLHNQKGMLIGYAGRIVDDTLLSDENPKYRFPGERKRNGEVYEFRKSDFIYNGWRIAKAVDDLVVVEGFVSVWWLTQNDIPNVVATMGADCSEKQAELIVSAVKPNGRVWVVADGDKAGERHALTVLGVVGKKRFVRWVELKEGCQPTDYSGDFLRERMST